MYPYNLQREPIESQDTKREPHDGTRKDYVCDKKLAEMILHSYKYEVSNNSYYKALSRLSKDMRSEKVFKDIVLDCTKHCHMLSDICDEFSIDKHITNLEEKSVYAGYYDEIEACIFTLTDDVEFYRHIMFSDSRIRDRIHELIIDKQLHISKLLFLHSSKA